MTANDRQVGGDHYRKVPGEQHWDRVHRLNLNYFQACITAYVERYRDKNGVEDLKKARHFLDKLIELETARAAAEQGKKVGIVLQGDDPLRFSTVSAGPLWDADDVKPADRSGS